MRQGTVSQRPRRAYPSSRSASVSTAAVTIAIVVAITYARDPHGLGNTLFSALGLVCLVACWVGPSLWKVRSASTRFLPGLAALFFLLAVPVRELQIVVVGPVQAADVLSVVAFVIIVAWTVGLSQRYYPQNRLDFWIDVLLVVTGAGLILWSLAIAPSLATGEIAYGRASSAFYCAWDVVVISLAAQLLYRAGALVVAMAWCLVALACLLVTDVGFVLLSSGSGGNALPSAPALTALYSVALTALALGVCHPSVRLLDSPSEVAGVTTAVNGRRSGFFVFFMTPSLACLLYPSAGPVDTAVRGVLLTAILLLVYIRLQQGLHALAVSEQVNRDRSLHDPLTSLANRASLAESLPRLAAEAGMAGRAHGLYLLDFDGFKRINDTWGHGVGDDFLRSIAERLRECTHDAEVVARLGGDEFLVALTAVDTSALAGHASAVHEAFLDVLTTPNAASAVITPSIGVAAVDPGGHLDPVELMRRADMALYAAKRAGRSRVVVYDGEVARHDELRARLHGDFDAALRSGSVRMEFTPIVTSGAEPRVVGWEASARWHHPVEGPVPPEVFVPVAEEKGLLDELTWQGVREAGAFLRQRDATDDVAGREWVGLNVSPRQLLGDTFGERFLERVSAEGVDPARLRVEVREDVAVVNVHTAIRSLEELRAGGVRVVVDDFGRGFASMGLVRRVAVDAVKIDAGYVVGAIGSASAEVLRAIVLLLRALHVPEVTVGGVDSPEAARLVQSLDVDLVQGRFYEGGEHAAPAPRAGRLGLAG